MKCECEIIRNETKMKYQSWKWRELKKMEWNIIWKTKTEMNEMISIELLFIEWIEMIVICDAHWKFHCVYHETEMFSKRMKKKQRRNESTFHSYITQYSCNFMS